MDEKIVRQVTKYYGVTVEEIKTSRSAAHARAMLCYLLKRHTNMKISEIGKLVNRDHATVVMGVHRIEEELASLEKTRKEVDSLEEMIVGNEESRVEKFLDFFRLEPVDDFKPRCDKQISGVMELTIRLIGWILTAGIGYFFGNFSGAAFVVLALCSGIVISEFLWGGFKQLAYIQDIVLHSLSVMGFVIATIYFEQHLAGLAIMGVAKCFTDLEYRHLYNIDELNDELLYDWESYMARSFKLSFLAIGIACLIMFKLVDLI